MKNFIIKFNNIMCYIAMIIVILSGLCCMLITPSLYGVLCGVVVIIGGLIVVFLLSGFWFVLSATYEESRKQTVLLEKLSEKAK